MIAVPQNGLIMTPIIEGGDVVEPLAERVLGRVAAADVLDPAGENVVVPAGTLLDEHWVGVLEEQSIDKCWCGR